MLYKYYKNVKKNCKLRVLYVILATLQGCVSHLESFDSKSTEGVGLKSISQVNVMVDQNQIKNLEDDQVKKLPKDFIEIGSGDFEDEHYFDEDEIRKKQSLMRIWIAPYQDEWGNLHEASTIHTVIGSSWRIKNDFALR